MEMDSDGQFFLFPLVAQSLSDFQRHGARLANSPSETGTLLCFSPEDLLFIAIDLQSHNDGASTTNAIEFVWSYAQKVSAQFRAPANHVRLVEIDSMGYIDEYVGNGSKPAWKAFGTGLRKEIPPRTVDALQALIHDRFEPFLRLINNTLDAFGLALVSSRPPADYPCVDGHVFLLKQTPRVFR